MDLPWGIQATDIQKDASLENIQLLAACPHGASILADQWLLGYAGLPPTSLCILQCTWVCFVHGTHGRKAKQTSTPVSLQ